jgi:hypothetical protein
VFLFVYGQLSGESLSSHKTEYVPGLHALNGKSRHHQKRAQIHGSGVIDFTVTNF